MIGWGYLVYAAIDFGSAARAGEQRAWAFLVVASLGAVACLFVGLMLVARLLRTLGVTADPSAPSTAPSAAPSEAPSAAPSVVPPAPRTDPRPVGGRRAAR